MQEGPVDKEETPEKRRRREPEGDRRGRVTTRAQKRLMALDQSRGVQAPEIPEPEVFDDARSGTSPASTTRRGPESRVVDYNARIREARRERQQRKKLTKTESAQVRKAVIADYKAEIRETIPEMALALEKVGLLSSSSESDHEPNTRSDSDRRQSREEAREGAEGRLPHVGPGKEAVTVEQLLFSSLPRVVPPKPTGEQRMGEGPSIAPAQGDEPPPFWNGDVRAAGEAVVSRLVEEHSRLNISQRELLIGTLKGICSGRDYNELTTLPGGINCDGDYAEATREEKTQDLTKEEGGKSRTFLKTGDEINRRDKKTEGGPFSPRRKKLSAAAAALARRMAGTKEQFTRIRGFIAGGDRNPAFCSAVCARLLGHATLDSLRRSGGSGPECRNLLANMEIWAGRTSLQTGETEPEKNDPPVELRRLENRSSMEVMTTLALDAAGGGCGVDVVRRGGEALVLNKLSASLLAPRRVCPFCLASELLGVSIRDLEGVASGDVVQPGEVLQRMLEDGSQGAAAAMARNHNREMHALNGNIFFSTNAGTSRPDVVGNCVTKSLGPVKHGHVVQQPEESRNLIIQEEIPMVTYGMTTSAGVSLMSVPPTRHQVYWFLDSLVEPDPDVVSLETSSPRIDEAVSPRPGQGAGTSTQCAGENGGAGHAEQEEGNDAGKEATGGGEGGEGHGVAGPGDVGQGAQAFQGRGEGGGAVRNLRETAARAANRLSRQWRGACGIQDRTARHREMRQLLQAMHDRGKGCVPLPEGGGLGAELETLAIDEDPERREVTWIGIGEDTAQNKGSLSLTTAGAEVSRITDDPTVRDGRVNSTYSRHVWRYLADSPLLQSVLTEGSSLAQADITPLLIKARLYDHLRHHSTGFPTGVEWGIPLKAATPFEYRMRREAEYMEVCVVSTRYLDEICHSGIRAIDVGADQWSLDDPQTAVVSLDYNSVNTPALWALQLLMAAPYPLVDLDEFFIITGEEGADQLKLTAMRRNECCVTINNRRSRFILVHSVGHATLNQT
ncbi:unnamed protein product [Spodoptera exigua]|nr:unnamed protein product [Spodoptera exigua]